MFVRLRRAMRLRQVIAAIVGIVIGILTNVASSFFVEPHPWLVYVIGVIGLIALVAIIIMDIRGPVRVELNLRPVKTIRTAAEKESIARPGLIGIVSLYRPFGNTSVTSRNPEDWKAAAERLDYAALDFPNSNLAPLIQAISIHASKLLHCWLITTSSSDPRFWGSNVYAPVLVKYLQKEHHMKCTFHFGPELELPLEDDAEVFNKTVERAQNALAQARQLGLKEEEVIGDFTGGVRGMTLGMILSRLDGDCDLQVMGSHYKPNGEPTPPLFPIIFSFEPILHNKY